MKKDFCINEDNLLKELGRFFSIASTGISDMEMPDSMVDEMWHKLLEDEKSYRDFCNKHASAYIHHIPNDTVYVERKSLNWVKLYETKYGKLDKSWFVDSKGKFNETSYNEYIDNGTLNMAWKCSPVIEDFD